MSLDKMNSTERRAVGLLSAIMSLRLLGLFMILPVFSLYANDLPGATPLLIGVAMGIYGLTQGLLQIPFGMLSDHLGRKPIITLGLLIFAVGCVIAAESHTIYGMVIGRALQGAGAVGSTIIAMIADLTRETQRTKAMAINGISIGVSFTLSMIIGPILAAWIAVSGIFWLAMCFSLFAIFLLFFAVPQPEHTTWHSDAEPEPAQFFKILKDPELLRLNTGVFLLHAIFTASFVVIPIGLKEYAGLPGPQQWYIYVPALLLGFLLSVSCMMRAEKKQQVKHYYIFGIMLLGISSLILCTMPSSLLASALGILLFFTGFSLLEAFLPSWVSRAAPKARKGTALGIFSCSQFLGIFVGGSLGGWLYGTFGLLHVYLFCGLFALIWLAVAFGMTNPQHTKPSIAS